MYLFIYLSIHLPFLIFIHLSVNLFIHPFIHVRTYPIIIYLFTSLCLQMVIFFFWLKIFLVILSGFLFFGMFFCEEHYC